MNIIDYSPYSLAVFGDTKPIKDKLKLIGGKFNMYLTLPNGGKGPGWIVSISKRSELEYLLRETNIQDESSLKLNKVDDIVDTIAQNQVEVPKDIHVNLKPSSSEMGNKLNNSFLCQIVNYSPYNLAVFGDTKPIKDKLKLIGGKFNMYLTLPNGGKGPGWIVSISKRSELEYLLRETNFMGHSNQVETVFSPSQATSLKIDEDDHESCVKNDSGNVMINQNTNIKEVKELNTTKNDIVMKSVYDSTHSQSDNNKLDNVMEIFEYSKYSLAIFGDTKPHKEKLKEIGAKYNQYLKYNGEERRAGWIVPVSKEMQVNDMLGKYIVQKRKREICEESDDIVVATKARNDV